MNLDNQRIAIRERGIFEIMDLALHVLRAQVWELVFAMVLPATGMIFLSHYLLADTLADELETEDYMAAEYFYYLLVYTAIGTPIVTAPATVLLGRATFGETTSPLQLLRDLLRCSPQFILFQVLGRAA
ncbi:MAG: hypothetical protein KDA42_16820, partial [Planctomycetales bacterium]|nr:hypothetical protein [Planctomycetales bacterium]